MALTISINGPVTDPDWRDGAVDLLRAAGYTVLDPRRHATVSGSTREDLAGLQAMDVARSHLTLTWEPGEPQASIDTGPLSPWLRAPMLFQSIQGALSYLQERAADDDVRMTPEVF